jgi:phage terminase small subunit
MPKLNNERHERFCQGLAAGMNQTQAYIAAGFRSQPGAGAAQSASRLRRNPVVAARVLELGRIQDMSRYALQEKIEREVLSGTVELVRGVVVTRELVRARLLEIVERSMQHRPVLDSAGREQVMQTPSGELKAAYCYEPKAAIAALHLLGKEAGMFGARHPSGPGPGEPGDFDNLTEEQLEREIAEEVAKITAEKAIANASAGR